MPTWWFLPLACIGGSIIWRRTGGRETRHRLYFYTGLGLFIGFGWIALPLAPLFAQSYRAFGFPYLTVFALDDVTLKTLIVVALIALVLFGERRPLSSIGIVRPHLWDFALGFAFFAIGEVAMVLFALALPHSYAASAVSSRALFLRLPLSMMLLMALGNGIFEEIAARGFAVERLSEVMHNTFSGASIALAINVAAHLPFWGWRATLIKVPALAAFLVLYLWRRSVIPCAIGHILNDAFPALLVAMTPMALKVLTPYLPVTQQGAAYYTKGNFDRAIQLFNSALARNPRDAYALQQRGLAYLNKKDYPMAFADLTAAVKLDPNDAEPYRHRAFAYMSRGEYDHAIADLAQAIRLEPNDPGAYEMRARIDLSQKDFTSAVSDYGRAIRADPTNADLYRRRGDAERLNRDYEDAILDYRRVLTFKPKDPDAWRDLASTYTANSEYDSALAALARALAIYPSTDTYHQRASVYRIQKRYDLALADWNRALAQQQDDPVAYNSMAWMLATSADPKMRDAKNALALAIKACELTGWKDGQSLDTLAAAYAAAGDFNHALEFQNKAIELMKPDDPVTNGARARLQLYEHRHPYIEASK